MIEENTTIRINHDSVPDQRTYNAPISDEVAGILVDPTVETRMHGPHILVHGKSNKKHQIKHYHGCYDPQQYPIIFPLGDCGWHPGLKKVADNVKRVIIPDTAVASTSAAEMEEAIIDANAGAYSSLLPLSII